MKPLRQAVLTVPLFLLHSPVIHQQLAIRANIPFPSSVTVRYLRMPACLDHL